MRCPKCRFTSFDDLAACAKCSNDLSTIAQELQGTCTETRLPFFLSSVVQIQELEDQTFSASQALPPIDDTDINFNDTMVGDFSSSADANQTMTGFDESIDFSDDADDISLELGDIMPIDLDQLDEPIDLQDGGIFDATEVLSLDNEEDAVAEDDIDLNFTDDFSDLSADFDETAIMSADSFGPNQDQTVALDLSGDFAAFDLDEGEDLQATRPGEYPTLADSETAGLELDNETELSLGDDLDLTGDFDENVNLDLSGDFAAFDLDDTSPGTDDIDLDLTGDFDESVNLDLSGDFAAFDLADTGSGPDDIDLDLTGDFAEDVNLDLSGDFAAFDLADSGTDTKDIDLDLTGDFDDTLLGTATEAAEAEQLADELLAPLDDGLTLELDELEADQPVGEINLDDTLLQVLEDEAATGAEPFRADDTLAEKDLFDFSDTLTETATAATDEDQLGDELLASMDDGFDLNLEELEADQPVGEINLDDSLIQVLDDEAATGAETFRADDTLAEKDLFDFSDTLTETATAATDEDQLGDELLASMDDGFDLNLEELEADQPVGEINLDDSLIQVLDDEAATGAETFRADDTLAEKDLFDFSDTLTETTTAATDEDQLGDELLASMDDEFDLNLDELETDQQVVGEDSPADSLLEGEELDDDSFAPGKSPSLGLEQIDVSDLLSSSAIDAEPAPDDNEEIDLTSLMETDAESHASDLELLDEEIPTIEPIDEDDDDEGPPDLP